MNIPRICDSFLHEFQFYQYETTFYKFEENLITNIHIECKLMCELQLFV